MVPNTYEPIFNSGLGKALESKLPNRDVGVENTGVIDGKPSLRPDIIVHHTGGLPVIIETEFAPASTVEVDARERLGEKLSMTGDVIEQVIALRAPDFLKTDSKLEQAIDVAKFDICVIFDNDDMPRWPENGWAEVDVNGLASVVELTSLSENCVKQSMEVLMKGVQQAATNLRAAGGSEKGHPSMLEDIAKVLCQKEGEQTSRMAMSIITNALTFHMSIAGSHEIETLDEIRRTDEQSLLSREAILRSWEYIYEEVNYIPIFHLAAQLLEQIKNDKIAKKILNQLDKVARKLASLGATSQHDLNGRLLQQLIVDRKYLATFYTIPSSARLLAELAMTRLAPNRQLDWGDSEAVSDLRIVDFACGTGALLNSAYGALLSRHRRAGGNDKELHPQMMEKVLFGTDIMPVATHLTASVLSSTFPAIPFKSTSIAALPYGHQPKERGGHVAIGSLELINKQIAMSLFDRGERRLQGSTAGSTEDLDLPHKSFDLVIMNAPFTRSVGKEADRKKVPRPAFAGLETNEIEQERMDERLRDITSGKLGMAGDVKAGLASNFIDLAHAKVKEGGIIALVLPATYVAGKAWSKARKLIEGNYKDICIVSITTTGKHDRAFSADTGMAEILLVAVRAGGGGHGIVQGTLISNSARKLYWKLLQLRRLSIEYLLVRHLKYG